MKEVNTLTLHHVLIHELMKDKLCLRFVLFKIKLQMSLQNQSK